jgi:hypothetical protein
MSTTSHSIPADVAAHVLAHYGQEGGYQAGGFTQLIISAIDRADPTNKAKLELGFPEYVAAVNVAQYSRNGIEYLQSIVRGGAAA